MVGDESRAKEEEGGAGEGEGRQKEEEEGAGDGRQQEDAGLREEQGVPASINLKR